MRSSLLTPLLAAGAVHAWLPHERDLLAFNQTHRFEQLGKRFKPTLPNGITKIRGVNLGAWLIAEPFFLGDNIWKNTMGCGDSKSEFDCMLDHYQGGNRDLGNQKFEDHWASWIDPASVQSIHDVGLNTIRIPIGYWSYVDIVDKASEPFPDGNRMLKYLDAVIEKAASLGMYVIIDLHGAPGGQQQDVFTGQNPSPAGFFNDYNYGRAEKWLTWMTNRIHSTPAYQQAVGMIEVLNEPVSRHDGGGRFPAPGEDPGLVTDYYPGALKAVRDAEAARNVPDSQKLHVQFMSSKWDSGDPRTSAAVKNDPLTAYDDHNYIGFALPNGDKYSLMHSACSDSRVVSGQDFAITGEWSMTSNVDDGRDGSWYNQWFTAQQQLYESPGMDGWVFWTWRTELNDPRWTYSFATYLNFIPTDAVSLQNNVFREVCNGYR